MDPIFKQLISKKDAIRSEFAELWEKAEQGAIEPKQAQLTLELLYKRSLLDLYEKSPALAEEYPAHQGYRNRLKKVQALAWLDHATAGINGWGTLDWFSNKQRTHMLKFSKLQAANECAKLHKGTVAKRDDNFYVSWKGYAGAITHFVIALDGTPFMLLPLEDGAWGEPKRNGDAIQVEVVNPLVVNRKGSDWYYWAGRIPDEMVKTQRPTELGKPFRGATHMMPYLWEQVITNIKLKRLCIAATTGPTGPRMASERMSQHTNWRESKFDMGPLWPFEMCNKAAFENYPIAEYSFFANFTKAEESKVAITFDEVKQLEAQALNPDVNHDLGDYDETIDSVKEIQEALLKLYPSALAKYGADGSLGAETIIAVKQFQADWNRNTPTERIKEDGIPGIITCKKLEQALKNAKFKSTQI